MAISSVKADNSVKTIDYKTQKQSPHNLRLRPTESPKQSLIVYHLYHYIISNIIPAAVVPGIYFTFFVGIAYLIFFVGITFDGMIYILNSTYIMFTFLHPGYPPIPFSVPKMMKTPA